MTNVDNSMPMMKKNIFTPLLGLALALLLGTGIFMFFGHYKVVAFCDEIYSYYTANSGCGMGTRIVYGEWYSSEDALRELTPECGRFFQRTLENSFHDEHPPIYFLTFHVISLFYGMNATKWVGLSVNFLAMIMMVMAGYLLAYRATKQWLVSVLASVALVSAPGVVGCLMLLRMYALLSAFALIYVVLLDVIIERSEKFTRFDVLLHLLVGGVTVLAFLTHYYFAIYAVGFGIFFTWFCFKNRYIKKWIAHVFSSLLALLVATAIWPRWMGHIFDGYTGKEIMASASSATDLLTELWQGIFVWIPQDIFGVSLWWLMIPVLAGIIMVARKSYKKKSLLLITLGASLFYCLVVSHVTPKYYLSHRYFYIATVTLYTSVILALTECGKTLIEWLGKKYSKCASYENVAGIVMILLILLLNAFNVLSEDGVAYVDLTGETQRTERLLQEEYGQLQRVVYGYENWTMMQAYYNFAKGPEWVVYNDQTDFPEGLCPTHGEDFLLFIEDDVYGTTEYNSINPEYTLDWVLEKFDHMEGCKHEIKKVFTMGMPVYLISHIH